MKLVAQGEPLQPSVTTKERDGEAVLVKVEAAGVCHSDLHLIDGAYDLGNGKRLPTGISLPITLGHEIAGTVEKISDRFGESSTTSRIARGDRVVVYPWIGCGSCRKCKGGLENLCEGKPRFLGIYLDGGYSDYVLVPSPRYLVRADGMNPKELAPLACSGLTAYSSIKKCKLGSDDLLVIIGAGGLGTIAVQIVKKTTRAKVTVLDIDEGKLELASQLGADCVLNSSRLEEREIVSKLKETNHGRGADAVIDFVGIPQTASIGFRCLGKEGKLVVVGLSGGLLQLSLPLLPLLGAEIIGNFTGTVQDLIELVGIAKQGLVSPFVSAEYPLEDANQALEKLRRGEVKGRVILRP